MLRTILCLLVALLYVIITMPVLLYFKLIEKKDPGKRDHMAMVMIQWVFRVFLRLSGIRMQVIGRENIPSDQAVLFIGNHRSIFDVIATYTQMERPCGYVAKDNLEKIPFFATWTRLIGCLFFDRNNLKDGMRMRLDAIEKIKRGESVFIFPEGTRNKNESDLPLLPFHEGSFRIATKTGCPIVPVAITNMISLFEKQFPKLRPVPVVIEFGQPIDPSAFTKAEQKHLGAHVSQIITEMKEKHKI